MAEDICPVWVGYLLANPLRKLLHNPRKILSPHIKEGDRVIDVGSAMGFFSIPAAKMAGNTGKVYCLDIQQEMLDTLTGRAKKAGVDSIIETRLTTSDSYNIADLKSEIDVAITFAVIHEVPDREALFHELYSALKTGGKVLVSEPKGHVSEEHFDSSLSRAVNAGFSVVSKGIEKMGRMAVLIKE